MKEREVREIFSLNAQSKERKNLLSIIRNEGNLSNAVNGEIIPKKILNKSESVLNTDYSICMHCKGYYKRNNLSRHVKKCFANTTSEASNNRDRTLSKSLVFSACQKKYGEILNKLMVKNQIFSRMQSDIVTETAVEDLLIIFFGEDLLKRNNSKRNLYHISNKLRECGKFILTMREIGSYTDMLSVLKPENFDDVIEGTKRISKYDPDSRSFGAASLALHFGTTLKKISDLATKLILRGKVPLIVANLEKKLTDLERFKKIIESQWATEIGSLALKDLNTKSATKPMLLPVTEDIIKLKSYAENSAQLAYTALKTNPKDIEQYRILIECVLICTLLHNRKRVGDIQYLEFNSYLEQIQDTTKCTVQTEMCKSLSASEKILTNNYKRIISVGKGTKSASILIPRCLQKYYSLIEDLRHNPTWFPPQNIYFFTYPYSLKWINGCSILSKYGKLCKAKDPALLTSSRLRKHIATVTQVLNLKGNEIDQLAKFMGHTTKTHEQFYK